MNCDMRDKTGQKVKASHCQRRDVLLFPVLIRRRMTVCSHMLPRFKIEAEIVSFYVTPISDISQDTVPDISSISGVSGVSQSLCRFSCLLFVKLSYLVT